MIGHVKGGAWRRREVGGGDWREGARGGIIESLLTMVEGLGAWALVLSNGRLEDAL